MYNIKEIIKKIVALFLQVISQHQCHTNEVQYTKSKNKRIKIKN